MLKATSNTRGEIDTIVLNQESATIGRNDSNTLALEDPKRYISGQHAIINYHNSAYFITDTSTNGVFINKGTQPVGNGNNVKLNDGDQLRIGEYIVNVSVVSERKSAEEYVANEGLDFSDDPFVELSNDSVQGMIDGNQWEKKNPVMENLNNPDLDFFDLTSKGDDSISEVEPPSAFKEAFQPFVTEKKEQKIVSTNELIGEDWFNTEVRDDQSAIESVEYEKKSTPLKIANTQAEILIDNFLRGVGLSNTEIDQSLTPESFYIIGKMLRASIQGTMDVLVGRSKIKNEMHLDVTMIRSRENNPVKLSVSVEEAIRKLLAPQDEGYLLASEAIEEAFDDIRAHQFSVIAGMQTALLDVLKRFDPEKLEQRFQRQNPISSSIPIHKQAKLWELFEHLYNDIEHEAADNFYHLFGQAFAESYEQQMIKLKNSKKR